MLGYWYLRLGIQGQFISIIEFRGIIYSIGNDKDDQKKCGCNKFLMARLIFYQINRDQVMFNKWLCSLYFLYCPVVFNVRLYATNWNTYNVVIYRHYFLVAILLFILLVRKFNNLKHWVVRSILSTYLILQNVSFLTSSC